LMQKNKKLEGENSKQTPCSLPIAKATNYATKP
jgi:hypothetical protein